MKPVMQLSSLISRVCELYFLIGSEELERCGVTKPQMLVIQQLKQGPRTIGEISRLVDLSYSTTSGIIDRMERHQMVVRKKDERDRRVVWVSLAQHLKDLEDKLPFLQEQYNEELFSRVKPEDMEGIMQSLQIVYTCFAHKWDALKREKGSEHE
ncbi:MarR family winged helix-turn-helix transcriptional regulator [Brevibacillus fluminis]|uniref:MarR family winged helix-turn-helix transcriptional regulator n=1 Tax=Brevibacillus fluminis TaxID=511487 RepID=UPI003F8B52C8